MKPLFLHQEIMLLALRDHEGTTIGAMYNYSIAGAVMSELLIQKRIEVTDDKKQLVTLAPTKVNTAPFGNPLLDETEYRSKFGVVSS